MQRRRPAAATADVGARPSAQAPRDRSAAIPRQLDVWQFLGLERGPAPEPHGRPRDPAAACAAMPVRRTASTRLSVRSSARRRSSASPGAARGASWSAPSPKASASISKSSSPASTIRRARRSPCSSRCSASTISRRSRCSSWRRRRSAATCRPSSALPISMPPWRSSVAEILVSGLARRPRRFPPRHAPVFAENGKRRPVGTPDRDRPRQSRPCRTTESRARRHRLTAGLTLRRDRGTNGPSLSSISTTQTSGSKRRLLGEALGDRSRPESRVA